MNETSLRAWIWLPACIFGALLIALVVVEITAPRSTQTLTHPLLARKNTAPTEPHLSAEELVRDEMKRRIHTNFSWVGYEDIWSFNANDNATEYASQYLWPIVPETQHRAPCGGNAQCPSPEQDEADCIVTVTDCKMSDGQGNYVEPTVLETRHLRCSGLKNCWHDRGDAKRCCREVP